MLLDDLSDYLTTGGITGTIYKGTMPEAPDAAVAICETGGVASVHAMSGAAGQAQVENPRVQVLCRATQDDYESARTKAHAVFKLLDGMPERTLNGTRYLWARAVQSPFLMGRDENGRVLIACNYDVIKELTA